MADAYRPFGKEFPAEDDWMEKIIARAGEIRRLESTQ